MQKRSLYYQLLLFWIRKMFSFSTELALFLVGRVFAKVWRISDLLTRSTCWAVVLLLMQHTFECVESYLISCFPLRENAHLFCNLNITHRFCSVTYILHFLFSNTFQIMVKPTSILILPYYSRIRILYVCLCEALWCKTCLLFTVLHKWNKLETSFKASITILERVL